MLTRQGVLRLYQAEFQCLANIDVDSLERALSSPMADRSQNLTWLKKQNTTHA